MSIEITTFFVDYRITGPSCPLCGHRTWDVVPDLRLRCCGCQYRYDGYWPMELLWQKLQQDVVRYQPEATASIHQVRDEQGDPRHVVGVRQQRSPRTNESGFPISEECPSARRAHEVVDLHGVGEVNAGRALAASACDSKPLDCHEVDPGFLRHSSLSPSGDVGSSHEPASPGEAEAPSEVAP